MDKTKLTFANKFMREFDLSRDNRAEVLGFMKMINSVFTSVTVAYCTGIFMDAISLLLLKVTSLMLSTSDATKADVRPSNFSKDSENT